MRSIQLSPRLKFIADLVIPTHHLADIGTDHGYLPLVLLRTKKIQYASLCDINEGPLNNARQTFLNSGYEEQISYKLGSGLAVLKRGEANSAIIAGMGGSLIQSLLQDSEDVFQVMSQVILQPMTEQSDLRAWLIARGYKDFVDYYVKEGNKLYEIIAIKPLNELAETRQDETKVSEDSEAFIEVFRISKDLEFGYRVSYATRSSYDLLLQMKKNKYEKILRATNSLPDTDIRRINCFDKLKTIEKIKAYMADL
jgi:tRNA (adenine22-N1)-methyltransferase